MRKDNGLSLSTDCGGFSKTSDGDSGVFKRKKDVTYSDDERLR